MIPLNINVNAFLRLNLTISSYQGSENTYNKKNRIKLKTSQPNKHMGYLKCTK